MEPLADALEYGYLATMNETLKLVTYHVEQSRIACGDRDIGIHLKMASRALRCALEIYGDRVAEMQKEKKSEV